MARTRDLKAQFFTDGALCKLSLPARFLFAALWCLADREGRLEDVPEDIEIFAFPRDDMDVDALLNELSPRFVTRYEVDSVRYIQVNNFSKHQSVHPREKASKIPPIPEFSNQGSPRQEKANLGEPRQEKANQGWQSHPVTSGTSGTSGTSDRDTGGGGNARAREAVLPGDEDNPFTGGPPPEPTVESYIANELPPMTPGNIDQLTALQEAGMQDDAIKLAVDIAAGNNRRTWAYTHAILRRWEQSGVFTAGAARAAEDERARAAPRARAPTQDDRADFFARRAKELENDES